MLFSLTNPEIAILMMGMFLFAVLLGFPIAFTLMAMGNWVWIFCILRCNNDGAHF